MMLSRSRLVAVLGAGALWFFCNALTSITQVKGQEVSANYFPLCRDHPETIFSHRCNPRPINGRCTGYFEFTSFYDKICDKNSMVAYTPCYSSTATVTGLTNFSHCYKDTKSGICYANPKEVKGYPKKVQIENASWCVNGEVAQRMDIAPTYMASRL